MSPLERIEHVLSEMLRRHEEYTPHPRSGEYHSGHADLPKAVAALRRVTSCAQEAVYTDDAYWLLEQVANALEGREEGK